MAISRPDEVGFTVEQVSLRTMVKSVLSLRYQYGFTLESGLEERQARTCSSEIAFFFVEPQKNVLLDRRQFQECVHCLRTCVLLKPGDSSNFVCTYFALPITPH